MMKFIETCGFLKIGHPTIDQQHQVLFDISNTFHSEVSKGRSQRAILEALNQLISYAEKHFSTEEEIISQLDLPDDMFENHQNVHEKLIMDIFNLNDAFVSGKENSVNKVEIFLTRWLVLHILVEDMKYKPFLPK